MNLKPFNAESHMMRSPRTAIFFLIVFLITLTHSVAWAKPVTITSSHTYTLGDNDSRNDARHMCFLEAKRKLMEKAGTFISSQTKVVNGKLDKNEINTFTAALVKVKASDEKWNMNKAGAMTVTMKVKATLDMSKLKKQFEAINSDSVAQTKIKEQQRRLNLLEHEVAKLQKHLGQAKGSTASKLRSERNLVFKKIDQLQAKKIAIMEKIKSKGANVPELIEYGMHEYEVHSLIGRPRVTEILLDMENYGKYWIKYDNNHIVSGVYACDGDYYCEGKDARKIK
ncbi:hypothetical protein [Desulfovibrio sp. JC022]|uniref:hypothetical protein n=1 Tax=Desulfovibrio sp. JC022 TaxID=2593642 RepID=UPI0013D0543E|nr:hypothetical protein [Desulfovibrio sp. JC022]NDV24708.1 hypothetical protein [Desulfovibrio sp. JC022]